MAAFDFEVKKGDEVVRTGTVAAEDEETASAFVDNLLARKFAAFVDPEGYEAQTGQEFEGEAHDPDDLTVTLKERK